MTERNEIRLDVLEIGPVRQLPDVVDIGRYGAIAICADGVGTQEVKSKLAPAPVVAARVS